MRVKIKRLRLEVVVPEKKIAYKGIVDIDFKFDKIANEYKVLDINPRIGASFRLFLAENGLDLIRVAYLDLTGQDIPKTQTIEGRKWLVENRDLVSSARYLYDRKITFPDWIRSYRGVKETAWWSSNDPLPFFIMITRFVRDVSYYLHKNKRDSWKRLYNSKKIDKTKPNKNNKKKNNHI